MDREQATLFNPPEAVAPKPAKIEIIGLIGLDVDPAALYREIKAVPPTTPIAVDLHSGGGSAFGAYLIHNALVAHKAPVSVEIVAFAASAGSFIPLAADPGQLRIAKLGQVMIHRSRVGIYDTAAGLEREAALLRKIDDQMAALYAERTGMKSEEALALMDEDHFMTSEEALELGLVDEIVEREPSAVRLDLSALGDVPAAVMALFGLGGEPEPEPVDPIAALLLGPPESRPQDLGPKDFQATDPGILALASAAILAAGELS